MITAENISFVQVSQGSTFAPVAADLLSCGHLFDDDKDFCWPPCVLNQLCTSWKFCQKASIIVALIFHQHLILMPATPQRVSPNLLVKLLNFNFYFLSPHRFIVRIMCSVLGMHVRQKNPRSRDKNTRLYMCNHVTEFDHNVINLLTPCNTVSNSDVWHRCAGICSNYELYIALLGNCCHSNCHVYMYIIWLNQLTRVSVSPSGP